MKTLALRGLRSHGEADPVGNLVRHGQIAETAGLDLLAAGEDRS